MTTRTFLLAIAVALAVLAAGAPAAPAMQLGLQNDDALVAGDSAAFMTRAAYLNAGTVRIMISDTRWAAGQADAYERAARIAHDGGERVMVSLMAYDSHPTPAEWKLFTAAVVQRLAPVVDVWSIMNEPNLPKLAAATGTRCVVVTDDVMTPLVSTVRGVRVERRWKHVRRGHGTHRRVIKHRHHRRVVKFVRAHGRRAHRRADWKRVTRRLSTATPATTVVHTTRERDVCQAEAFGQAYRRVWDTAAPVVRYLDADAQLVVGDTCPCFDPHAFMDAFYGDDDPSVEPDVLGVHPYLWADPTRGGGRDWQMDDLEDAGDYAKAHHVALWVTEWGQQQDAPTSWWTRGLDRIKAAGARVAVLYDTNSGPGWDTHMDDQAFAAVAAWAS